jgi:hypothetical protein
MKKLIEIRPTRKLAWAVGAVAVVLLSSTSANANVRCQRRYQDLALPVYDRLVVVYARKQLTCTQAARVGSAVADAYERGLPTADYPPLPRGVAGGRGRPFKIHTRRYGTYSCRMTARGSDFVSAKCHRGSTYLHFTSLNHWFFHGH